MCPLHYDKLGNTSLHIGNVSSQRTPEDSIKELLCVCGVCVRFGLYLGPDILGCGLASEDWVAQLPLPRTGLASGMGSNKQQYSVLTTYMEAYCIYLGRGIYSTLPNLKEPEIRFSTLQYNTTASHGRVVCVVCGLLFPDYTL